MRIPRLRRLALTAVLATALAWSASAARAGQRYSAEDLLLVPAAVPEGWTLAKPGEPTPAETALKDAIVAAAKDTGVADKLTVILRTLTASGGANALVALVNAESKADAVLAALTAAAGGKDWTVRDLGDPTVLLVVAGAPETRAAAVDLQVAHAVRMLTTRAERALESPGGRARAEALAKSIGGLAPKSAAVGYLGGILAMGLAFEAGQSGSGDANKHFVEAANQFAKALAKDAVPPLTPTQRTMASGLRGQALLQSASGKPSPEARDALKEAVTAKDQTGIPRQQRLGWRYDLACAHARLKELDAAFEHLGAVLEEHAKSPVNGIGHWKDEDPDFANLKTDPRWEALVKKHGASAGSGGGGATSEG